MSNDIWEAAKTLLNWILRGMGQVTRAIAWYQIFKEYLVMVEMLDRVEDLRKETNQSCDCGKDFRNIRGGVYGGIEALCVRNQRFLKRFLWFFANIILVFLLNSVLW